MEEKNLPALEAIEPRYNNKMIYQSNPLIESCKQMDIMTGRLFYTALMEITPQLTPGNVEHDFQEIVVPADTIVRLFGGNKGYYSKLEQVADRLMEQKVIIKNEAKQTYDATNMFERMHFSAKEGGLHILFTNSMKPHLLTLAGRQYTRIAAKTIFSMKSMYSIRLLELLLQYQNIESFKTAHCIQRYMTVDEIRFYLNVPDSKTYRRMSDFRRQVLDKPIADINKRTGYVLSYEVKKRGREVEGFDFALILPGESDENISVEKIIDLNEAIRRSYVDEKATVDNLDTDVQEVLRHYGVGKTVAYRLSRDFSEKQIRNNISYSLSQKRVKNLGGYIIRAIREDFFSTRQAVQNAHQKERRATSTKNETTQMKLFEASTPQAKEITEVSDFFAEIIISTYRKGEKIRPDYIKILQQIGLTVEDVLAGKRRKDN